ncbi:hypothetical protein K7432_003313 [Basidiobolus ranarum]|uniref:Ubiquitin-like protease family profile domain-containing protein n=1 Tax=Basidiobolus ranarum TaxID=34480 RepID=A0ABR2X058_9FUNG
MHPQSFIKQKELDPGKLIEQALHDRTIPPSRFYQSPTRASSSTHFSTFDSPTRTKRKLSTKLLRQERDKITSRDSFDKCKKQTLQSGLENAQEGLNRSKRPRIERDLSAFEHKPLNLVEILDNERDSKPLLVSPPKKLYRKELSFQNSHVSPTKQIQKPQSISLIEKEKKPSTPTNKRNHSCVWVSDEEEPEHEDLGKSEKPILIGTPDDVPGDNHSLTTSKGKISVQPSFQIVATPEDQHKIKDPFGTPVLKSSEASIVIGTPEDQDCSVEPRQHSPVRDSMSPELFTTPSKLKSRETDASVKYIPCAQRPMMGLECLLIGCKHYNGVTERILLSYSQDSIQLYHGCDQLAIIPTARITSVKYYNQTHPYLVVLKTNRRLKNEKFAEYYNPDDLTPKKTQIQCFFKHPPDKLIECLEKTLRFSCEPLSKLEWDKLCNESSPDYTSTKYKGKDLHLYHYFGNIDISKSARGNEESTGNRNSLLQRSPAKTPRSHSRKTILKNKQSLELFVYPFNRVNALAVTSDDVSRLSEGEFLNDTLVEFYMRYIQNDLSKKNPTLADRVHFFNPFFYHRLTHKDSSSNAYERVKKWTSKIDLFEKDYIFVPINENLHWYLALICFPALLLNDTHLDQPETRPKTDDVYECNDEVTVIDVHLIEDSAPQSIDEDMKADNSKSPWIIIFDSLNSRHENVFEVLNTYLYHEAKEKKNIKIREKAKGIYAKVPCQTNHCDCGVYLLQYVETFLSDSKKYLNFAVDQMEDTTAWFTRQDIGGKREQIRNLIYKLSEEYTNIQGTSKA